MKLLFSIVFLLIICKSQAQFGNEELDTLHVFTSMEEALKNPDNVFALRLKGNLSELPKEVLQFTNLRSLNLKGNRIHNLPKEITSLENLKKIDLSKNKLEVIPKEIFEIKSLKILVLSENLIAELPPEIGKLKGLEFLDIWSNLIESIPAEIGSLPNLKLIDLQVVEFTKQEQAEIKENFPTIEFKFSSPCACETH